VISLTGKLGFRTEKVDSRLKKFLTTGIHGIPEINVRTASQEEAIKLTSHRGEA